MNEAQDYQKPRPSLWVTAGIDEVVGVVHGTKRKGPQALRTPVTREEAQLPLDCEESSIREFGTHAVIGYARSTMSPPSATISAGPGCCRDLVAQGDIDDACERRESGRHAGEKRRQRRRGAVRTQDERNAFHAAGHLVLGWYYGLEPRRVALPSSRDDRRSQKFICELEECDVSYILEKHMGRESAPRELESQGKAMAEILLAGHLAMVRNEDGRCRSDLLSHGDVHADIRHAKRLARQFSPLGMEGEWLMQRRSVVQAIMSDPIVWSAVKAAAEALTPGCDMSDQQLGAILDRRGAPKRNFDHQLEEKRRWKRYELELEHVAYHEAGHAVIAEIQGLEVRQVEMMFEAPNLGCVHSDPFPFLVCIGDPPYIPGYYGSTVEAQIRMLLAGRLAAAKALKGRMRRRVRNGARCDNQHLIRLARALVGPGIETFELILRLETETTKLLDAPLIWHSVRAVAALLAPGVRLNRSDVIFELQAQGICLPHLPPYRLAV